MITVKILPFHLTKKATKNRTEFSPSELSGWRQRERRRAALGRLTKALGRLTAALGWLTAALGRLTAAGVAHRGTGAAHVGRREGRSGLAGAPRASMLGGGISWKSVAPSSLPCV